jgi:hypothetical protein
MTRLPLFLRRLAYWFAGLTLSIAWAQDPVASSTRLVVDSGPAALPAADGSRTFNVRVRSVADSGQTVMDPRTNVILHAYTFAPAALVVSEVARDYQEFEFTHVGEEPLDLANWTIRTLDGFSQPNSARRLVGPAILAPGGVLRWSARTNAPNAFPDLAETTPFGRNGVSIVEVCNPAGELVDQVVVGSLSQIAEPRWSGPSATPTGSATNSLSRSGRLNRFHFLDWTSGPSSFGRVNPGLVLPWRGTRQSALPTPVAIILTNGVWEGLLTIPTGTAHRLQWAAGFGDGLLWDNPIQSVPPVPSLILELTSGTTHGTEASPGPLAVVRLRLPSASVASTNQRVALAWSAAGEFASPAEVVVPAGATEVTFPVEALDDAFADARSRVRLTARLTGHAPASLEFTLDDNESGTLQISLPAFGPEGSPSLSSPSWVLLPATALHDTEIELAGEGRLRTPARVVVPAGAHSARFDLQILEDTYFNQSLASDIVRATTQGWPAANASLRVIDNDLPGITVDAPENVIEGTPTVGQIRFRSPPDRPIEFRLSSQPMGLIHPSRVTVPAGANAVEFALSRIDDLEATPGIGVQLTLTAPGLEPLTKPLSVLDNDYPAQSLSVLLESVMLSTGPSRLRLQLQDAAQQSIARDGPVELRMVGNLGDAALASNSVSVPLIQGRFDGDIQFTGTGIGTVLEAVFGTITNRSSPFDLTPGRSFNLPVADVARWPGHSNLLALRLLTNGPAVSGQLIELDPALGTVVRHLELPRPAARLAVADAGTVAWLGSATSTLQRIDLAAWTVVREVTIASTGGVRRIQALAVSPGTTDDLAVLTLPSQLGPQNSVRLTGLRQGQPVGEQILDPQGYGADVIPGRAPGEFYSVCTKIVNRWILGDSGLVRAAEGNLWARPSAYVVHPVLADAGLVFGDGHVLDPETLMDRPDFAPQTGFPRRTTVLPFPELDLVVFANESRNLVTYDATQRTEVIRRILPAPTGGPVLDRLIRWGSRGAALLSWTDQQLVLIDDAPFRPGPADLAIGIAVPSEQTAPADPNVSISIEATLSVTNRGPAFAADVVLSFAPFQTLKLGGMQPGEVRVVPWSYFAPFPGRRSFSPSVSSPTPDPDGLNNTASAQTLVMPESSTVYQAFHLPARHLVNGPDGTELWLAVGPDAAPAGIAVVNPETGQRLRTLPVGDDPRRLAFAPNGRAVYVQLGTHRLVRWNLDTAAIDFDQEFPGDAVLDFVSLPEPLERLAVLRRGRLSLFEGNAIVQGFDLPESEQGGLGVQGTRLWVARPDALRAYQINPGNLNLAINRSLFIASANYQFVVQGKHLFFDGRVVDVNGGERDYFLTSGIPWIPAGNVAYGAQGSLLRRHRLTDLQVDSEVSVPGLSRTGGLLDQVRWGTDGFAFRTESGLLITTRSPVVSLGETDLALSVQGPDTAYFNQPVELRFVATNRGPGTVQSSQIRIRVEGGNRVSTPGRPSFSIDGSIVIPGEPLPPGRSFTVTLRTTPNRFPFPAESMTVHASLLAGATDPTPAETSLSKTLTTTFVPADIAVTLQIPPASDAPEFEVTCLVTNRGPGVVIEPGLALEPVAGLTLKATDRGIIDRDCCSSILIGSVVPSLAAGESARVTLRFQHTGPGVYPISVRPNFLTVDPQPTDNQGRGAFLVPQPDGQARFPGFRLPFQDAQWSPARNQWIVSEPRGLNFLAPVTLKPQGAFGFTDEVREFHLTDDGRSVWIPTAPNQATRYHLDTGVADLTVNSTLATAGGTGLIIPIPGQPGVIVVFGLDELGKMEVIAYDQGVARPVKYIDDLRWAGRSLRGVGGPEGRVYISNGAQLRELELRADGLQLLRNLDSFNRSTDIRMAVANGLLIQGFNEALDLRSLDFVPLGNVTRPSPGGVGYQQVFVNPLERVLQAFDLERRRLVWQINLASQSGLMASGGSAGVLFFGPAGGWFPTPPNPGADLQVTATLGVQPLGVGQDFTIELGLRQEGVWLGSNLKLLADLPPGLELVSPVGAVPAGQLPITESIGSQTVPVVLRARQPGVHPVTFRLTSDSPDPTPTDARATVEVRVPEEPRLLLTDVVTADNDRPLILRLSTPAPRPLTVRLQAELIDAQADDLTALTYEVQFPTGIREAEVRWIARDLRLEPDERFRISLLPGDITATPATALVTIVNDDRASIQARPVSQLEGNTNGTPTFLSIQLDQSQSLPVEVDFTTISGTALAGEDFLPVAGRLYFAPGQRTNLIAIPIVGDRRLERNEVFSVDLSDAFGILLPNALPTVTLRNDDAPASPVAVLGRDPDGRLVISFPSEIGATYVLQSRTNLTQGIWQTEPGTLPGTGGVLTVRPPNRPDSLRLYRLQAN